MQNLDEALRLRPVLLQAKRKPVQGYRKVYVDLEDAAIKKAGFEVMELETSMFGIQDAPDYDLKGRFVFCRHYANEDYYFVPYIEAHGGHLAVPNYAAAADWYKVLPLSSMSHDFLGGRTIAWYSLKPFGYLEEDGQFDDLRRLVDTAFKEHAIGGKVFAKSETKNSFTAKLYTKKELLDDLSFLLGVGCHRTPGELIISTPIDIAPAKTDYKIDEYRCLIVDGHVSTVSLYTDEHRDRDYTEVIRFANKFAAQFENYLPNSYDLDVARLANGDLAVIELNDIAACGYFADHDLGKLYRDIYALALTVG